MGLYMTEQLCNEPTPLGPCTMKKGHEARWHRHHIYPKTEWIMRNEKGILLAEGSGINPLTAAISRNRKDGITLLVEIECDNG